MARPSINQVSPSLAAPVRPGLLTGIFALLLLGGLGWSLKERAVPDLFKFQLNLFSNNSLLLNSMLGAVPSLLSMIVGPLVGGWSDRSNSRFGRRIPFLLVCVPFICLSLVGMAYGDAICSVLIPWLSAPPVSPQLGRLIWLCLCWTLYSLFTLLANALFIALIKEHVPSPLLGRFFGLLRIVSLAVGVLFFQAFFGNSLGVIAQPLILTIAALYLICLVAVCTCLPRLTKQLQPTEISDVSLPYGRLTADHYHIFSAAALCALVIIPANINSFNAIASYHVSCAQYGRTIAAGYCMSILLALPVGWASDRYHPSRVGCTALALYGLCMFFAIWLVTDAATYQVWLFLHIVLAGTILTASAPLLPLTLPPERFSSLAALSASLTALLTVVLSLCLGFILDRNSHDFRAVFLVATILALSGALCWGGLARRMRA